MLGEETDVRFLFQTKYLIETFFENKFSIYVWLIDYQSVGTFLFLKNWRQTVNHSGEKHNQPTNNNNHLYTTNKSYILFMFNYCSILRIIYWL